MSLRSAFLSGLFGWLILIGNTRSVLARGGGGCFEQGTPVLTPSGPAAIEQLRPGDTVWSLSDGHLQHATVMDCMQVRPRVYYEFRLGDAVLRVTSEHPFQIAPGIFRQAAHLKTGDTVWRWIENRLQAVPIESIAIVQANRSAFNLLVSPGGTFLANGFLVHNKGCFLPDTPVLKADGTSVPISEVRPGDALTAFTPEGGVVSTTVRRILTHEVDVYWLLTTDRIMLRVTSEHPFFIGNGEFRTLEALKTGDVIYAFDGQGLSPQTIRSLDRIEARAS